jgi:hypothetical protein
MTNKEILEELRTYSDKSLITLAKESELSIIPEDSLLRKTSVKFYGEEDGNVEKRWFTTKKSVTHNNCFSYILWEDWKQNATMIGKCLMLILSDQIIAQNVVQQNK